MFANPAFANLRLAVVHSLAEDLCLTDNHLRYQSVINGTAKTWKRKIIIDKTPPNCCPPLPIKSWFPKGPFEKITVFMKFHPK